ncbi:MAG: hypothetical protein HKL90_03750 [Elusimicrobia bacterium]|nr:hypothetical protein [Elusimicrobiota bacterium]
MKSAPAHAHEKPHHPHWPLAALLFAGVFSMAWAGPHGPDAWIRVACGRTILATGALPHTDPFSYGAARAPWTPDSWLTDVLFAKADALGGPGLVRALAAAAAAAGFALLLPISHGNPLAAAGLLAVAAGSAWTGFLEAPAAFDFLFFAVFLRLLRPRHRFRLADGAAAAGLTALWANMHGATASLALALAFLKAFKASLRSATREALGYWAMFAACVIAFSWNPLGYGVFEHLFADAASGATRWQTALVSPAGALILLGLGACALTLQQEFVTTLASATVMALSLARPGLRPLAAMAACPVLALALGHAVKPRADTPKRVLRWGVPAALLILGIHYAVVVRPLADARGYGAPALEGAARFLDAQGVRGQMFNDPALGAELIGLTGRPVFVDERPGLYPDAFLAEAEAWPRTFPALDAVYRFDYAVVPRRREGEPARALDADPGWREAYADDFAQVYLKRSGGGR